MSAEIRLATPADASAMCAIYAPVVRETAITFELEVPTEAKFRERITSTLEERPWLACEISGDIAGYAYAGAHRHRAAYGWSVEPSVYVSSDRRRRGVATALYTSLFAALKAQGFCNAYARTTLPNDASVALHKSFGFKPVGTYRSAGYKLGTWHDVACWQLSLHESRSKEGLETPQPLQEIRGNTALKHAINEGATKLNV